MITKITHKGISYHIDLNKPIDISIPLRAGENNVNAWYGKPVRFEPVVNGNWIGDVNKGGSVNFRDVFFNPHANGTHTECVGHISKEDYTINQCLKTFFFVAELITVLPLELKNGDKIITLKQIKNCLGDKSPEAIVIRTLDNHISKINFQYSNTNPPYIEESVANFLSEKNINHLLIDLPSIDKELDEGKLLAHHAFWQYPNNTQSQRTITEMIYVPNNVFDGTYLLNLQIASFENDASPSKPLLFLLNKAI
jgi:kynurenine formamidase